MVFSWEDEVNPAGHHRKRVEFSKNSFPEASHWPKPTGRQRTREPLDSVLLGLCMALGLREERRKRVCRGREKCTRHCQRSPNSSPVSTSLWTHTQRWSASAPYKHIWIPTLLTTALFYSKKNQNYSGGDGTTGQNIQKVRWAYDISMMLESKKAIIRPVSGGGRKGVKRPHRTPTGSMNGRWCREKITVITGRRWARDLWKYFLNDIKFL